MNVVIDSGNTQFKVGLFSGYDCVQVASFTSLATATVWVNEQQPENVLVSSVKTPATEILAGISASKKVALTPALALPIQVNYTTPHTLGADRLAAACGAAHLFPGEDCLVIDAGSCITYDFVDRKATFRGGAIAPGLQMRFAAMHHFTARLPSLQSWQAPVPLTGNSTEACMQSGVVNGMVEEINGFIARYKAVHGNLRIVLCGGDALFFENSCNPPIFVAPNLVLSGLNRILLHHVE
jgi:type III pantothenate kinase